MMEMTGGSFGGEIAEIALLLNRSDGGFTAPHPTVPQIQDTNTGLHRN